jgi:hypothetical protein
MVVELSESQVFIGQVAQAVDGGVYIGPAGRDRFQ